MAAPRPPASRPPAGPLRARTLERALRLGAGRQRLAQPLPLPQLHGHREGQRQHAGVRHQPVLQRAAAAGLGHHGIGAVGVHCGGTQHQGGAAVEKAAAACGGQTCAARPGWAPPLAMHSTRSAHRTRATEVSGEDGAERGVEGHVPVLHALGLPLVHQPAGRQGGSETRSQPGRCSGWAGSSTRFARLQRSKFPATCTPAWRWPGRDAALNPRQPTQVKVKVKVPLSTPSPGLQQVGVARQQHRLLHARRSVVADGGGAGGGRRLSEPRRQRHGAARAASRQECNAEGVQG